MNYLAQCVKHLISPPQIVIIIEGEKDHRVTQTWSRGKRARLSVFPVILEGRHNKVKATLDFFENHDELGESWSFLFIPELTLGSVWGTDQAAIYINLVFGPSQKKRWKNLERVGHPSDWIGEEWERNAQDARESSMDENELISSATVRVRREPSCCLVWNS